MVARAFEVADELGQQAGGDRDGAGLGDDRADPDPGPDFQVGGAERQRTALGRQQDVAEDGQGAAAADGAADGIERVGQLLLVDGDVHGRPF